MISSFPFISNMNYNYPNTFYFFGNYCTFLPFCQLFPFITFYTLKVKYSWRTKHLTIKSLFCKILCIYNRGSFAFVVCFLQHRVKISTIVSFNVLQEFHIFSILMLILKIFVYIYQHFKGKKNSKPLDFINSNYKKIYVLFQTFSEKLILIILHKSVSYSRRNNYYRLHVFIHLSRLLQ